MPHSFNKIWIHAIWATKERQPFIHTEVESKIFDYMRMQFIDLGCPVRIINGMPDHVHCLFLLNPQKSIADVIKQVKGSTSHFINEQNLLSYKFAWQTGYAAYSVSESILERVFEYIQNQKEHHSKKSFQQEYDGLLKLYGLSDLQ
jgi:REP element-mobilizing transposase RayT